MLNEGKMLSVCAWCKKVKVHQSWEAPSRPPKASTKTHGICPSCKINLKKEFEDLTLKNSSNPSYFHKI